MASHPATERQLSVEQVATQLGVHPETIRRAIRKGEVKVTRNRLAPGSPFLVSAAEVRAFVARRTA